MRLSIIVPVYNAAAFLDGCVDSIRGDTEKDWELILVNDGSTDESGSLCQHYAEIDDRIRVIHQQNRGPGGARNTGLADARGEFIWFVDSDDRIVPGALAQLRQAMEQYEAEIYSFDYLADDGCGHLRETSASFGPREQVFSLEEHPEALHSMPATWLRLWKRSLFSENGISFPARAFYGEDLRTTVKLLSVAKSVVILPRTLYCYLDRPGSLMNQASEGRNQHMLEAFSDLSRWFAQRRPELQYREALTDLAVEHLLLATTVRISKANPKSELLGRIRGLMEEEFPRWRQCAYVKNLSGMKKLALFLVEHRLYGLLGLLFRLKG